MSALARLVQIHRWDLEQRRKRLAELEQLAAKTRRQIAEVDEQIEEEKEHAARSPEGSWLFASFLNVALTRRKRAEARLASLDAAMAKARAEVQQSFGELKKFEVASEQQEERRAEEDKRRQQIEFDELGLTTHRRRAGGEEPLS